MKETWGGPDVAEVYLLVFTVLNVEATKKWRKLYNEVIKICRATARLIRSR